MPKQKPSNLPNLLRMRIQLIGMYRNEERKPAHYYVDLKRITATIEAEQKKELLIKTT